MKYQTTKDQDAFVDKKIDSILGTIIKPAMSDLDKQRAIHDWIVKNVQYDTTLQHKLDYDALTKGLAVCEGYAELNYKMLTKVGIPATFVFGTGNGQAHVWNTVKIYGKWYQEDVTWDDPVTTISHPISYSYFDISDSVMKRDHTWDASTAPTTPELLKLSADYFIPAGAKVWDASTPSGLTTIANDMLQKVRNHAASTDYYVSGPAESSALSHALRSAVGNYSKMYIKSAGAKIESALNYSSLLLSSQGYGKFHVDFLGIEPMLNSSLTNNEPHI